MAKRTRAHGLRAPESACGWLTGSFTSPEELAPQASPQARTPRSRSRAPSLRLPSDSHPPPPRTRGGAAARLTPAGRTRVSAATAEGHVAPRSFLMPRTGGTEAKRVGTDVRPASPRGCAERGAGRGARAQQERARTAGTCVWAWTCPCACALSSCAASSQEAPLCRAPAGWAERREAATRAARGSRWFGSTNEETRRCAAAFRESHSSFLARQRSPAGRGGHSWRPFRGSHGSHHSGDGNGDESRTAAWK